MMLNIYFDLDGTLLDVSERYWRLHSFLADRDGLTPVSRDQFWALKRARASVTEIVPDGDLARQRYWCEWIRLIESPTFLQWDRVFDGVESALTELSAQHRLVIVTMRRDADALATQLLDLGLGSLPRMVLTVGQGDGLWDEKHNLIMRDHGYDRRRSLIVGDTEEDINAGHRLGIPAIAVLSGLRGGRELGRVAPFASLSSVAALPGFLESAGLHTRTRH